MSIKKMARILQRDYGAVPDRHYYHDDLANTRAYFDYRRERDAQVFHLDEITWQDLSMDEVYKRINNTQSTSGEQLLYYQLRRPASTREELDRRRDLVAFVEQNDSLRLQIQLILARLGRRRAANTTAAFHPGDHSPGVLLLCLLMFGLLLFSLVALPFYSWAVRLVIVVAMVNLTLHTVLLKRLERDMDTVLYAVSMVVAARRLQKLGDPTLGRHLGSAFAAQKEAAVLRKIGGVSLASTNDLAFVANALLLTDIIAYELLKNRLVRHRDHVFRIHEDLGRLDAAISVASFRRSVEVYSIPTVDFSPQAAPFIRMEGLVHPLVKHPVANSVDTGGCILLTGSNASGKSTYLKGVALGAVLAQSIATALCRRYEATGFAVYTSMAIRDDLVAGDSYFVAEIKSLKRILDAMDRGERVLCAVDEVLRGTNTVERIAASSEVLLRMAGRWAVCVAATHDIELCGLLAGAYSLFHFTEQVEGDAVLFDYILRQGPATSRNAIKLLRVLGMDEQLVEKAEARARRFVRTGQWEGTAR